MGTIDPVRRLFYVYSAAPGWSASVFLCTLTLYFAAVLGLGIWPDA